MWEWMALAVLAGLSICDLKWKKVNVTVVLIVGFFALGYRLYCGTGCKELLLGLIPGAVVLLTAVCTRESIGTGDGLILCVLGIFCGMKITWAVLGMGLLLCSLLAMVLLVCKRAGKKTELPFLPCLCAGYLIFLLW